MEVFSADRIKAVHEASLEVLKRLGMKVFLPEARKVFARAGGIVEDAITSAPMRIEGLAEAASRDIVLELGSLVFQSGADEPRATDEIRGRHPGRARDFKKLI